MLDQASKPKSSTEIAYMRAGELLFHLNWLAKTPLWIPEEPCKIKNQKALAKIEGKSTTSTLMT